MSADLPNTEQCDDAPYRLALHERLALSALVAGVNVWIRVGEVIPDRRRRRR